MKAEHFDYLATISENFIATVDSLIPAVQADTARDADFSAAVQADRKAARKESVSREISTAAADAKRRADAELDTMKAAFSRYMVTLTHPEALQSLQAILSAGVELSEREIETYAALNDYPILRVLAPRSKGRIQCPDPANFEKDMRDLADYFGTIGAYAGPNAELSEYTTSRVYGLPPKTGSTIVKGRAENLRGNLDELASRWECVREN